MWKLPTTYYVVYTVKFGKNAKRNTHIYLWRWWRLCVVHISRALKFENSTINWIIKGRTYLYDYASKINAALWIFTRLHPDHHQKKLLIFFHIFEKGHHSIFLPFLKGELCLFRLLLFLAQRSDEAAEDFFRAGLFFSASRCSFRSWSRFCFCKAIRCCCKDKLGTRPRI